MKILEYENKRYILVKRKANIGEMILVNNENIDILKVMSVYTDEIIHDSGRRIAHRNYIVLENTF